MVIAENICYIGYSNLSIGGICSERLEHLSTGECVCVGVYVDWTRASQSTDAKNGAAAPLGGTQTGLRTRVPSQLASGRCRC